ncbi:uncharacterized protein VTP21DRAFT_9654 [Calcarisporiella thermophila]|uniref:uncharacterized protein n=1 Tax=Calcarisporiella thermophila TaxID=911321 RepID=UPI00374384FF
MDNDSTSSSEDETGGSDQDTGEGNSSGSNTDKAPTEDQITELLLRGKGRLAKHRNYSSAQKKWCAANNTPPFQAPTLAIAAFLVEQHKEKSQSLINFIVQRSERSNRQRKFQATEKELVDKIIRGLKLRTREEIKYKNPSTLNDAVREAERYDAVYFRDRNRPELNFRASTSREKSEKRTIIVGKIQVPVLIGISIGTEGENILSDNSPPSQFNTTNQHGVLLMNRGFLDKYPVKVLVDGGASDNFQICSRKLVDVHLRFGDYEQVLNFVVAYLPHYDIVLGKLWLAENNSQINWRENMVTIWYKDQEIMLKDTQCNSVEILTAMQFKRVTKGHKIYAVILKEENDAEPPQLNMNKDIGEIIASYENVFPNELPAGLPPERTVDHHIELAPGTEPSSKATYRLSYPEMDKMHRQLQELLRKGFIQPSNSLFGEPTKLITAPTIKVPNPNEKFIVITNASDFAIGAHKLSASDQNYATRKKELFAIVRELRTWRHYLHGQTFTVYSDHALLRYFQTQPTFTRRQARWVETLQEFQFEIKYQPGRNNTVADALSRRPDFRVNTISTLLPPDDVKEVILGFCVRNNFLFFGEGESKNQLCISNDKELQWQILRENHDITIAGHLGIEKTCERIHRFFYWPRSRDAVKKYVKSCEIWQRTKTSNNLPTGFLQPLETPTQKWQQVLVDLINVKTKSASDNLSIAKSRHAQYANQDCREEEFNIGYKVMISTANIQLASQRPTRKLQHKFIGPYENINKISPVVYKVKLPESLRIHPVFNVHF